MFHPSEFLFLWKLQTFSLFISRKFCDSMAQCAHHSVEKREIFSHQKNISWNHLFSKMLSRNFCQKCVKENFRNFSLTLFWQKFRETNIFTKEVTKELISRNIFSVRENFLFFHTVHCGNYGNLLSLKKYFVKLSTYLVISYLLLLSRNFCQKCVRGNSPQ